MAGAVSGDFSAASHAGWKPDSYFLPWLRTIRDALALDRAAGQVAARERNVRCVTFQAERTGKLHAVRLNALLWRYSLTCTALFPLGPPGSLLAPWRGSHPRAQEEDPQLSGLPGNSCS